jgi:hypothetical protein
MLRSVMRCCVVAGAIGLAACDLEVVNPNNPETRRVLATPTDVEALLGTTYLRWHSSLYWALASGWGLLAVQSFENFTSLANNGQGAHSAIPRPAYDNQLGSAYLGEYRRVYFISSEAARTASNVLVRLNTPGFTLGTPARDARARAFAEFVRGLTLGYIALLYDSGSVIGPELDTQDPGELVPYRDVMAAALSALQASLDAANLQVAGSDGFPLPTSWLPSATSMTQAQFVRLVRTYRARFRALVARDPTERAAVDWDAVIADAQNGITQDHTNTMNSTTGPFYSWVSQLMSSFIWHQMTPFIIGMADTSGSYAAWIAAPLEQRSAGGLTPLIVTPDKRFPQGTTRPQQNADFAIPCPAPASGPAYKACKRYYVNRSEGNDQNLGPTWGWSNYDHARFTRWQRFGDAGSALNGEFPFFTKAELDLLEAEGHFRRGNYAAAAALINKTRVANGGLPAITAFDATSPVPGGAQGCVPKRPVNARNSGGGTVVCGTMFDALKYEKWIETQYTHYAAWFFENRGWGALIEGNGVHFPVPYTDLLARGRPVSALYNTGGTGLGNTGTAGPSIYGW